jgi:catalase
MADTFSARSPRSADPNAIATVPTPEPASNALPGTGWEDRAESPPVIALLARRVATQQKLVANGSPALGGRVGRGQHQKQLLGAFGTLRIREGLPHTVRGGPFVPGLYKVACRISNGQPCPFHDQAPDVRGIAVKFFTLAGAETDLVMTNEGGRSHARDAVEFTDVADVLAAFVLPGGTLKAMGKLLRTVFKRLGGPARAARVAAILGKETVLHKVQSMMTEHYWGSVVRLGDAAMKYSAHPHEETAAGTDANRSSPDYLRDDLRHRLAKGSLRFTVAVQFFADEARTPVNDASVAWRAPLVTIGEIDLPALPTAEEEAAIDRMAFNPGNGFEPLGITHARKAAYATSAKNRGAMGTDHARDWIARARAAAATK